MNDTDMNEKICRWLGWTDVHAENFAPFCIVGVKPGGSSNSVWPIPNFTSDLNDIAEAEKGLVRGERDCRETYRRNLLEIFISENKHNGWDVCHATALQRARALVAVIEQKKP